ncbi:MAG: stalk domain-containing protein, partial [Candidatus Cryosericum sp.]
LVPSSSYRVSVSTNIDRTPVQSSTYQITGTSITGLTMTVDPKAQSAQVQVQASFQTSASGALAQNSGTIAIDFPSNMTIPSSINRSLVTVNGIQAASVSVLTGNVVNIVTPVAIAASSTVTIAIAGTAGIYNPSTSGTTVTISVSTSADLVPASWSYTTVTSQVTQPQVQLTSNGAGSVTGCTITFSTGAVGTLRAGYDTIVITFPSGTVLPATISRDLIKINNVAAYNATVSGLRLTIVPAVNVPASAAVQLVIDKTAGIKNPPTATSYTLQVSTSVEVTPVASASYTIVNLPKTIIVVSPASPDGLAGYYKTRPTVVLAATSPVDSNPVVYYSVNGGAQQVYATPFQLPDGNVTLTYYARDRQGNQEDAQTFTAKVDATPPTATIVSPAQGATVGTSPVTIVGKVAPGMQVNVAGTPVTVSPTGDFSTAVALKEGPQTITITVTSVSGNIGQTQLAITLDTTPPVLTITKPVMYSTVLTSICEVTGKTEPGAVVKVAGSAVTVNADGTFSSNVMLKEGDNLIEITATDAVGNQRKTAIPVTYKARTVIHLQVGNKTGMVNDTKKTLQVAPVIKSGNTMVPLRFIGEAFGATVTWDPVFQIIDISLRGSSIRLQVGTNYASVAGKKVILQGVPVIISGTTMVPIRFISEAFGAQVDWTAATQGIDITYPKP